MHYGVFQGTARPKFTTQAGDIIKLDFYEPLMNIFISCEVTVDHVEPMVDAIAIKGSTTIRDKPHRIVLHMSTRTPGNDSIRFFETD